MRRWVREFATLTTVVAVLAAAPAARAAEEVPAKFKVGDTAPDFTLQDLDGRQVRLSALTAEKVVLLNFWSLRCGACLGEVPHLNQLLKNFDGRKVAVLSVLTDGVDAADSRKIMQEVGAQPAYPVLVDQEFTVCDTYTNFVVPLTLVIDRKRVIRYVHTGFDPGTEKQYQAALKGALGS